MHSSLKDTIKESIENASEEILLKIKKLLQENYYIHTQAESLKLQRGIHKFLIF